jgi:dTDP-4-amino-4,6-dideoxy-D-galactose acyltransferase
MSEPNPPPCELLSWDTDFFGCRLARVRSNTLQPEVMAAIDDWCWSNQIRGLYFLSSADDPATIRIVEQHGFGLVDIRVTLARGLTNSGLPIDSFTVFGIHIRPVRPNDLPGLQAMARTGHQDTRFFSDRHFSRQRAEDLYSTWIYLETQGRAQVVFVAAGTNDQPIGYASCHLDAPGRKGQIGLVGVATEARGQGVGKCLVQAALDWFRNQGAQEVSVVTQGKNLAAQRLYQKCGFLSRNLELWYHKWYPIVG